MKDPIKVQIEGEFETKKVYVDGFRIEPKDSQTIINHSPDGFSWGYSGSGPAQLSLAILLHVFSKEKALSNYQQFKQTVISKLPQKDFCVTVDMDNFIIS